MGKWFVKHTLIYIVVVLRYKVGWVDGAIRDKDHCCVTHPHSETSAIAKLHHNILHQNNNRGQHQIIRNASISSLNLRIGKVMHPDRA